MDRADSTSTDGSLRVGYLLRMYPRLSQTFVVNEIAELERQGVDVTIASMRLPNEGLFHESVCRVKGRAYYAPASFRGKRRRMLARQWRFFRKSPRNYLRAAGTVRRDAQAEWGDLPRAIFALRWFKDHDLDHVHVHFGTSEATVALAASLLGDMPYSMTLHAFDIFRDNVDTDLLARKINGSRFTVTVSEFNRRYMVENLPGVNPDKIRVNYNGINLDRFQPGSEPREPMSIFGLGRLKEKKGFMHLVGAVRHLRDQGVHAKCRIGGEGPDEKKLRKAIQRWHLEDNVELLGPVNEPRVRELMQRSACLVLPCVQAKDGNVDALPTVLLEAMGCGCPVVSTRLSGVPEIIEDGTSGLLAEPGDDEALAAAIRAIFEDETLATSLGQAGRRRAEERFDVRRNVGVMRGWFADDVGARRGAEPRSRRAAERSGVRESAAGSVGVETA